MTHAAASTAALNATAAEKTRGTRADADIELVISAKGGDTAAFSELVNRHQQMVYNVAYRFMRDAVQAEDAAQEAFIKAYRSLEGFRGDCLFSTWMYRVTASVCLNHIERRKKRAEVELLPLHEDGAAAGLDRIDVPEVVRDCVGKLPDRYEKIVTLYYLKEFSYGDIARSMKVSKGTLKTWMHRARAQLRKILEKEYRLHGLE